MKKAIATALAGLLLVSTFSAIAVADEAAHCAALAQKWQKAKVDKASNPKFARAKVWAQSGARDCARGTSARQTDGVSEYIEALKLVGVAAR